MTLDPKKYARALRLTYSHLLSPEEVKPFLDAHYAGDSEALRVLKDKFQDEGDPRADIYHKYDHTIPTIGIHGVEDGYYHARWTPRLALKDVNGKELVGVKLGNFTRGPSSIPTAVLFSDSGTLRTAAYTPEDAREFADKFPSPHSEQIHAFLDQHFPDTKRPAPEAL